MCLFGSGSDQESEIRIKLELEWESVPLVNNRLLEDIEGRTDITSRLTLVYIAGFFTDGCDFLYYVKGGVNMSRFLLGTFSGKPYDKPCFATPAIVFDVDELVNSIGVDTFKLERVSKNESKGIRWKYLYESAVKAWEKLSWDEEKLEAIRKRNDEYDDRTLETSGSESQVTSDTGDDVEVAASEPGSPSTARTTPGFKEVDDGSDDNKEDVDDYDRVEDSDVSMGVSDDAEGDEDEEMI